MLAFIINDNIYEQSFPNTFAHTHHNKLLKGLLEKLCFKVFTHGY